MKLRKSRGAISSIIAVIILIAITVAGGLLVFALMTSTLTGSNQKTQVNFESLSLCRSTDMPEVLFAATLKNTGNRPVKLLIIHFSNESDYTVPSVTDSTPLDPGRTVGVTLTPPQIHSGWYVVGNAYSTTVRAEASEGSTFSAVANVKCLGTGEPKAFILTFAQTGLNSSATGTVVIVNGVDKTYSDLSYSIQAYLGDVVTYSFSDLISGSTENEGFTLLNITGLDSPITVTASETVTGNYAPYGWLMGLSYRKSHMINPAAGAGVGYQVKLTVYYGSGSDSGEKVYLNGKCKTNFGDVRFTSSDGITLLDYWIESQTSSQAVFWVEVAEDLSATARTIYVYYGKADATTTSSAEDTFIFGDDFSGTSLDPSKWTEWGSGSATVSGGYVFISSNSGGLGKSIRELTDRDLTNMRIITRLKVKTASTLTGSIFYATSDLSVKYWSVGGKPLEGGWRVYTRQSGVYDVRYASPNTVWGGVWYKQHTTILVSSIRNVRYNDDYTLRDDSSWISYDTTVARLMFGNEYNGWDQEYFDYIWIAKYVSPEPSHGAWGIEEVWT